METLIELIQEPTIQKGKYYVKQSMLMEMEVQIKFKNGPTMPMEIELDTNTIPMVMGTQTE